mmetsp:Transcript_4148/g.4005  ORF Transcript_4148/g.4005 Transcript_4148/m.4005 type:complete len:100 (+) Transcript_4148:115-414(+)
MPKYSSFLLANFINKLHLTIPNQDEMKQEHIMDSLYKTLAYFKSTTHEDKLKKVSDLEMIIEEKQAELIKMNAIKEVIDKRAKFRSNALITLGSTILIA